MLYTLTVMPYEELHSDIRTAIEACLMPNADGRLPVEIAPYDITMHTGGTYLVVASFRVLAYHMDQEEATLAAFKTEEEARGFALSFALHYLDHIDPSAQFALGRDGTEVGWVNLKMEEDMGNTTFLVKYANGWALTGLVPRVLQYVDRTGTPCAPSRAQLDRDAARPLGQRQYQRRYWKTKEELEALLLTLGMHKLPTTHGRDNGWQHG